ncbi:succinate-semialdehyde dehydrogenase/glutarate-semialdehyde dehydrogenase [Halarchaeum rubridurum]|uniref:Succinate-semialdehyde dehydrogenase n=1 Tax=Halarchaeum rubridurum TaxID=489911 RepID=A0A830FWE3_9EURY|nr:NAD-dependent succinate-semialdehyde dehydrogenase [Halarchaeum rubridurum]MBP1953151.1 succinate-semialdehyde dehydrogenase/glutarate-semialdehyde dehydrogenase [Halarchaeum rubridurum]GGM67496.1 succinate-semialdehyde dehydrogenase [Halarchaeum rubridurum]
MDRVNPATGEALGVVEADDEAEVETALETAAETFETWRDVPLAERENLLSNAADVLRENETEYAELMTEEMGKPLAAARSEVEKCAWVCDYYAEHAGEHLQDDHIGTEPGVDSFVAYEPLGPILAVMPWNFPFWQVFRFAAPHLTSGNVGLLKHASNVPGCAAAIEEVFREAGYPEGVFQTLLVGSDLVDDVVEDDRVKAVTLTGSERAGRAVAETAGAELKKTVLELGGSDPFVVLDDADVEAAAATGARARTINSGQSCIAAKRFVVHTDVYDEFVEAFVAEMDALDVGDPTADVDLGPQARADLMDDLHDQVERSVAAGAHVELGGEPLDREGFFYPPTVLTDVPRDSAVAEEEVFGPVAPVFEVADEAEAIDLANETDLGLGGSVWTADRERGTRVAREIESGTVFVNELTKSDPRLPFGGVGDSGYGRELGAMGIHEFVNRKTVWVQDAEEPADGPAGE